VFYGEKQHAVTLHWMEPEIDTGAIVEAGWFDLDDESTGLSVSSACVRHGIPLIDRLLDVAASDAESIKAEAQSLEDRRFFRRSDVPFGGRIPWDRPANEICRFVRACDYHPLESPWGTPMTELDNGLIGIAKARLTPRISKQPPGTVIERNSSAVIVATGDKDIEVSMGECEGGRQPAVNLLTAGARLK